MVLNKLTLSKITKLTHDVYELIFASADDFNVIPGQFVTFILPSGLRRAYSVAYQKGKTFEFIIKRLENGRGGSIEVCDLEVGCEISYIGPVGNFLLSDSEASKLFIGTGTGFAPLYFQIKAALEKGSKEKMRLIFGIRREEDIFYENELKKLKNDYTNFDYLLFLSREDTFKYRKGYVTDFLRSENIFNYHEYYICGSAQMVVDARSRLDKLGINKEKIFFEQY